MLKLDWTQGDTTGQVEVPSTTKKGQRAAVVPRCRVVRGQHVGRQHQGQGEHGHKRLVDEEGSGRPDLQGRSGGGTGALNIAPKP